jgi:hypothetical protein
MLINDYEGALLLYSFASLLGLPRASYAAGYLWENNLVGKFKCSLNNNMNCALYYYMNGIEYYKSKIKIADIIYFKLEDSNKYKFSEYL